METGPTKSTPATPVITRELFTKYVTEVRIFFSNRRSSHPTELATLATAQHFLCYHKQNQNLNFLFLFYTRMMYNGRFFAVGLFCCLYDSLFLQLELGLYPWGDDRKMSNTFFLLLSFEILHMCLYVCVFLYSWKK